MALGRQIGRDSQCWVWNVTWIHMVWWLQYRHHKDKLTHLVSQPVSNSEWVWDWSGWRWEAFTLVPSGLQDKCQLTSVNTSTQRNHARKGLFILHLCSLQRGRGKERILHHNHGNDPRPPYNSHPHCPVANGFLADHILVRLITTVVLGSSLVT